MSGLVRNAEHRYSGNEAQFEVQHDKTNIEAFAPSERSDEPQQLLSLVLVYAKGLG